MDYLIINIAFKIFQYLIMTIHKVLEYKTFVY